MPFVRYPGLAGKVYVPERAPADAKKHPCRDCFSCQMCSDGRCRSCLGKKSKGEAFLPCVCEKGA